MGIHSIRTKLVATALVATLLLITVTWLRGQGFVGIDRNIQEKAAEINQFHTSLLDIQGALIDAAADNDTRIERALDRIVPELQDERLSSLAAAYTTDKSPGKARALADHILTLNQKVLPQLQESLVIQARESALLNQGTALLSAFAFLTAIIMTLTQSNSLVHRVNELAQAAERIEAIGDGNQEDGPVTIEVRNDGGDELDRLGRLFNQMSRALHTRTQEVTTAWRQAVETNESKTKFLRWVSHELRTPLTTVYSLSEFLVGEVEEPLTPNQYEMCTHIRAGAVQLNAMVEDLLDLSRLEEGRLNLEWQQVDLDEVIDEVIQVVEGVRKPEVTIGVRVDDALPPMMGDHKRIGQVLTNLAANALRFTEEGSVTFVAREDPDLGGWTRISVVDTGSGISEKYLDTIFGEFQQTPGTKGGTGLGLTISQHLVRLHGSELQVASELGRGSEFFFSLPLAQIEPEEEQVTASPNGRPVLLVIDDDAAVSSTITQLLRPYGWNVIGCTEAEQALKKARQVQPDAIALDILLSSARDGWSVLRQLKSEGETRDIPVVVCSIVGDSGAEREGVAAYLEKPFTAPELWRVLETVAV